MHGFGKVIRVEDDKHPLTISPGWPSFSTSCREHRLGKVVVVPRGPDNLAPTFACVAADPALEFGHASLQVVHSLFQDFRAHVGKLPCRTFAFNSSLPALGGVGLRSKKREKSGDSNLEQVFLDFEIVDDEVLPLGRVLAHEEREEFIAAEEMIEVHRLQADVFADEILELAGGNFAQAFEAGDLVAGAQFDDRGLLFLLGITIHRLLLVAHAEQWRVENEEMIVADDVRKKLQEKREQQQTDVHAVDVGIGGDHDLVITQSIEPLLDVQCRLEQVKLLVLVNDLFRKAVGVERFSLERKDGLRLHVTRGRERSGGRIALDDEEGAFLGAGIFVAQMEAAVAQFAIVQRRFFCAFASEIADTRRVPCARARFPRFSA